MRCVIKIGGSLQTRSDVVARIGQWLEQDHAGEQINLLFGGGKVIDALRELESIYRLSTVDMHWRCVRALRLTYEIACEWFPQAMPIDTPQRFVEHRTRTTPGFFLLAVDSFYSPADGDILPQDWSTTSDSIAALLAHKLSIERLVLVKSCEIADTLTLSQAADAGIVDAAFPQIAHGLKVRLQSFP